MTASQADGDQPGSGGHRAAKRALALIELVAAEAEPMNLSELARRTNLPKSSAHALARTLDEEGYLERDHLGDYSLGPRLLALLGRLPDRHQLARVARPVMQELVDDLDETVLLGVRHHSQILYVEQVESKQLVRYVAPLGEPRPLHCTSMGKILLAEVDDEQARTLLRGAALQRFTDSTKVAESEILAELVDVRAHGFAFNREESIAGVTAVAVPIRMGPPRGDGRVAALSIVGPTERMRRLVDALPQQLKAAAERIGAGVSSR